MSTMIRVVFSCGCSAVRPAAGFAPAVGDEVWCHDHPDGDKALGEKPYGDEFVTLVAIEPVLAGVAEVGLGAATIQSAGLPATIHSECHRTDGSVASSTSPATLPAGLFDDYHLDPGDVLFIAVVAQGGSPPLCALCLGRGVVLHFDGSSREPPEDNPVFGPQPAAATPCPSCGGSGRPRVPRAPIPTETWEQPESNSEFMPGDPF